jgi:tetratricopeptide (TPR) repeat protein
MTAGAYDDGALGEVFLKLGKQGSTLAGVMDAFSIAISIALQYGVPLEAFVSKFVNMRFEPAGMTDDADIRISQSIMDYIFRRLALDHLPYDKREALGIFSADERSAAVAGYGAPVAIAPAADFDIAVEEDPDDVRTREMRGLSLLMAQRTDDALKNFDDALEVAPDSADILFQRGRVFASQGNFERAMADLDRAITAAPEAVEPRVLRARLRQQAGEDRMGVGDRHGEGKQPLRATCWSWSSR